MPDSTSVALGKLLITRLRSCESIDFEVVGEFVGANPNTVLHWATNPRAGYPKGERLNRLWYLLDALGFASPELDKLSSFHRYIGELHAFHVIKLMEDVGDEDFSICYLMGVKNEQDALRILRGSQTPVNPLVGKAPGTKSLSTDELERMYDSQLVAAKEKWRQRLVGAIRPGPGIQLRITWVHSTTPLQRPAPETDPGEAPAEQAPAASGTDSGPPSDDASTAQAAGDNIHASPMMPSAARYKLRRRTRARPQHSDKALGQPVEAPDLRPVIGAPMLDNTALMFALADKLASIVAMLNYALSDKCSDEERAFMREMLGQDNLHSIRLSLTRLTSTRAFNERA